MDIIARVLKRLGYAGLVLQWLWLIVLVAGVVIDMPIVRDYAEPVPMQISPAPDPTPSNPLMAMMGLAITAGIIFVTLVILIRVPKAAGEMTMRAVAETTRKIQPRLEKKYHIKPRKRRRFGLAVIAAVQIALSLIALVSTLLIAGYVTGLPVYISHFIGLWLAVATCLCFAAVYVVKKHAIK